MKLLVGLGNPGEQYTTTRHNLGFQVVEKFFKDASAVSDTIWSTHTKLKSEVALLDSANKDQSTERVILVKPHTYMNNSGMAVSLVSSFYKVAPEDVWVIYDELDLPLGSLKIRFGGAAAGHHGVESIMEKLGTDKFWRFRLGIGASRQHLNRDSDAPEKLPAIAKHQLKDAAEFVLGGFGKEEQGKARELIKHGAQALQLALEKGLETAMNRYNTK